MDDVTPAVEAPAAAPTPGTGTPSGQASSTPTAPENQAAPAAPSAQAPASTPKYRFKDQAEAERAHSELQSRYGKLGDPGQAAQRLALLGQLQSDPRFVEWAKARLAEQETGSGDPDTVKALETVQRLARQEAAALVAPLQAQAQAAKLAAVFQAMTQKHGAEWEQYKPKMAEIFQKGLQSGHFSPAANNNIDFDFVNHLYAIATSQDPEFAAKQYAKSLAKKQATSTQSTAGVAPSAVAPAHGKGMAAAYQAALKELRMG